MKEEITLISYATKEYEVSQRILNESAKNWGISNIISYNLTWLKKQKEFVLKNSRLLRKKRGAGYWIWKPLIILDALNKMKNEGILIYCDAGAEIISSIEPLIELCKKENGILLFSNGLKNSNWTKRDCFIEMGCDSIKYWRNDQVAATYQVYKNTKKTRGFIEEYLMFCQNPLCISDEPNNLGKSNLKGFIEHRHDQSILTNLAIKNKTKLYPDPSQYGNKLKRPFPQIFNSTRGPKGEITMMKKIHSFLPKNVKKLITFFRGKPRLYNIIK
jgi:hypothetical protein